MIVISAGSMSSFDFWNLTGNGKLMVSTLVNALVQNKIEVFAQGIFIHVCYSLYIIYSAFSVPVLDNIKCFGEDKIMKADIDRH